MAPKSSSTGKKLKGNSVADDSSVAASPKPKKIKIPKQFIVRPSPHSNTKNIAKVFIHEEILLELEDIHEGSFVYLNKSGELDGVIAIIGSVADCEHDVIQISHPLRNFAAYLLGDRVCLAKSRTQPSFCGSISVGSAVQGTVVPPVASKNIEKVLDEVGIVYPSMIIPDCRLKVDETEEKQAFDLVITDAADDSSLTKGMEELSLSSSTSNGSGTQPLFSPLFIFKRGSTQLELAQTNAISRLKYPHLPNPITYKSLGGLGNEIKSLKSTVEMPLHRSELFTQFGITPPRGILLHGPPGTGKTMLLKAVSNELNAHSLTINGPSIVSKYLGETESLIRDIFLEARKYQPSIIFIDEIDSLAPSRSSDDSGEVESRVVATLLTLMDGMGDSGRLVVVAATNRPNSVDLLLRRPGRFDQEIEIGIPDVDARDSILQIQFAKMQKHSLDAADISDIASKTHGFVGADLIALCRESVMKLIQRGLDNGEDQASLRVSLEDVNSALLEVRPSAMREIILEMPKVYWSDIGGQEEVKQKLKEMVQLPLQLAETFKKLGIKSPKGLLLYGPPGCSKTLTAKLLATESGINFLAVKGPEIFNKYVGESEKSIREIFRKARLLSPSIIFFDEIDAISQDRSEGDGSHTSNQVLTTLLNEIDGVEELNGVVIVAATNRPDSIDAALLRPGRLDRHIYVAPPDFDARLQILQKSCSKFNLDPAEVDLAEIAALTEGCSGAEISLLTQEAGLAAIMEDLETDRVLKKHFVHALSGLSRGITEEMLAYYREFADRSGIAV